MLGEEFCSHNVQLGVARLKEMGLEAVFMPNSLKGIQYLKDHPGARADDLKMAFGDDSIKGIICAIGGDDTYRLLPYLLEDQSFAETVKKNPKIFSGFSDTTINHLMFHKLNLVTYYGPAFITDLGDIGKEMLPYTRQAFNGYFKGQENNMILSSDIWYEERSDFSKASIGIERISHQEKRGYEVLKGKGKFRGQLLGGCLESLYDIFAGIRYHDEPVLCEKYSLFPSKDEWKDKILFIETCEEKPEPQIFKKELINLKEQGVFSQINGVLVGKPQDEQYYEEYKQILLEVISEENLPILYNVNFGHAYPRCVLPIGINTEVDLEKKTITHLESMFADT